MIRIHELPPGGPSFCPHLPRVSFTWKSTDKAWSTAADAVILDLEDAVLPASKDHARDSIRNWLNPDRPIWIRTNAVDSPWFARDVELVKKPGVAGIMLPKSEVIANELVQLLSKFRVALIPLVETVRGFKNADTLAATDGVVRLAFGSIDFQVDSGIDGEDEGLLFVRSHLVLASRLAGIGRPIDGVTADIQSETRLADDARRARALGFGAKLCIHPNQLEAVNQCLSPSEEEHRWARRVVEAASAGTAGAVALDGKLIDLPVIKKAQRILALPLGNQRLRTNI